VAYGATGKPWPWNEVLVAAAAAAALNAGSNSLNQICDLAIDEVNKPHRPLPSGEISWEGAAAFSVAMYALALGLAALVNRQTLAIYSIAAVATWMYSAGPFRTKRSAWGANLTIAAIRGELLKVAGWAAVSSVLATAEPWLIGSIFFVFLLGATTTKDFADMPGDRAAGCRTLPIVLGAERAAKTIAPFFLLPWIMCAAGAWTGLLSGNRTWLLILALAMFVWGAVVARMMIRDPAALVSEGENHPAWRQMYLMMMASHLGIAAAYLAARW
jgi:4-hydroxybenzoate polyprenyltransferase